MKTSAQNAMIHVMNLKKEDSVLVITDEYTKDVGDAFHDVAIDYGCTAQSYFLPEKDRPLLEIPTEMRELAKGKTIVINAF